MGTTTAPPVTIEEFVAMPEPEGCKIELIEGEVIVMGRGGPGHERVKSNAIRIFARWLDANPIGGLYAETMYSMGKHDGPIPDLSIQIPHRSAAGKEYASAPEIAIEIVSSETASKLQKKVRAYLRNGSKAVLVFYPDERCIVVHDPSRQAMSFEADQILELPDVLPGFSAPVADFFEGL